MTVEDPVECALPGISQTSVNRNVGLTYPAALRAFLRSDADVVMLGGLRDLETLELAAEITITGRLLLSVLHVSSAIGVIQRLREIGLAPFLTAQALAGAVGQRLVRKVCSECVTEYEPSPDDLQKAGLSPIEDGPFRRGAGCAACGNTGFQGRVGLFEVLEVPDRLRPLIAENAPYETLWRETFGRTGGSLWDDARDKVRAGLTTVEEVTWTLFDYPRLAPESPIESNSYPLPRLSGGTEMWQRFTERARRIVFYAQEEAGRLGEHNVCTEHLLLGMLREKDHVAAKIITGLGVSLEQIRADIEQQVVHGEGHQGQDMQLAPRAKRVVALAYEEANDLNNNYIGSEHLLLGMLREAEGLAGRVLLHLGIWERVKNEERPKSAQAARANSGTAAGRCHGRRNKCRRRVSKRMFRHTTLIQRRRRPGCRRRGRRNITLWCAWKSSGDQDGSPGAEGRSGCSAQRR